MPALRLPVGSLRFVTVACVSTAKILADIRLEQGVDVPRLSPPGQSQPATPAAK